MAMTDPIADMLTRIRNGQSTKLLSVLVPFSKFKLSILSVLKEEGYIGNYVIKTEKNQKFLDVELKYSKSGKAAILELHRVSRPGRRLYSAIKELHGYYNNLGIQILSTSKGVVSDRVARALGIGGEVVCKVF